MMALLKTKQLMVQSVRDLNQKRKMLVRCFDSVYHERSAQWLIDSRSESEHRTLCVLEQARALNSIEEIKAVKPKEEKKP